MTAASESPRSVLLRNVRHPGSQTLQDLLISEGQVAAIRPAGQLRSAHAQRTHDAEGRTVLPGLWDHHVHFTQWVIQQQRLDLSGATSAKEGDPAAAVASAAAQQILDPAHPRPSG